MDSHVAATMVSAFNPSMNRIPGYLNKYFQQNSFILVYPLTGQCLCQQIPDLKGSGSARLGLGARIVKLIVENNP